MTFAATGLSAEAIAAIEAAQAAAAAAGTVAAPVAEAAAAAAPALVEAAAPVAAEAAAPAASIAEAAAPENIASAIEQTANTAGSQMPGNAVVEQVPSMDPVSSMQSVNQPVVDPNYASAPNAPMSAESYIDAGGMGQGSPSIADQVQNLANKSGESLKNFGSKAMDALTDPKTLAGAGLNMGGTLMQQSALNAEEAKKQKEHDANMASIAKESDNLSRAIGGWGQQYLSADGMESSRAQSESDLNKTLGDILSSADRSTSAPNGNVSDEFTKAMGEGAARSADNATTYAKLMAKAQAPAFANVQSQIGALRANNDAMSAQSRINGIGAIDRASMGNLNPNTGAMLGGSVLQGIGSSVAKSK